MENLIGLVDCNNFFVSCERLFDPSLEGRPVAVLSSNDGCVIARSNELKALGVPMGVPYFEVKKLIENNDGVVRSSNFQLYGEISKRIASLLRNEYGRIQVYSVDESFIDMGHKSEMVALAQGKLLREKIRRWLGIPTSMGVAMTKTLAKVACQLAKKNKHMSGVCVLKDPKAIEGALKQIEVGDIWGVGRRRAEFLKKRGVETGWDLANLSESWVRRELTITGWRMVRELKGESCLEIEEVAEPNKSVIRSRSFSEKIYQFEDLMGAVAGHMTAASEVLRKQGSLAGVVTVFIRTSCHETRGMYRASDMTVLEEATDYTPTLLKAAERCLAKIYREGYGYKKAGVVLNGIVPRKESGMSLFVDHSNEVRNRMLMGVFDQVRDRYGRGGLYFGSTGARKVGPRSENRSPNYVGDWADIKIVRA